MHIYSFIHLLLSCIFISLYTIFIKNGRANLIVTSPKNAYSIIIKTADKCVFVGQRLAKILILTFALIVNRSNSQWILNPNPTKYLSLRPLQSLALKFFPLEVSCQHYLGWSMGAFVWIRTWDRPMVYDLSPMLSISGKSSTLSHPLQPTNESPSSNSASGAH